MKMKLSLKSKFKINVESECSISAKNWIQIILAWCFIFIALQSLKLLWLVLTNLDQNETFLGFVNHLLLQWWCEQIKWTTTSRIDLTNWAYKIIKMKFFGQSPFGGAVVVQVHFFFLFYHCNEGWNVWHLAHPCKLFFKIFAWKMKNLRSNKLKSEVYYAFIYTFYVPPN